MTCRLAVLAIALASVAALSACGDPAGPSTPSPIAILAARPSPAVMSACLMVTEQGVPMPSGATVEEFVSSLRPKVKWERSEGPSFILRQTAVDPVANTDIKASYLLVPLPTEATVAAISGYGMGCGTTGVLLQRVVFNGVEFNATDISALVIQVAGGQIQQRIMSTAQ